jgi:hypothetical protein
MITNEQANVLLNINRKQELSSPETRDELISYLKSGAYLRVDFMGSSAFCGLFWEDGRWVRNVPNLFTIEKYNEIEKIWESTPWGTSLYVYFDRDNKILQ